MAVDDLLKTLRAKPLLGDGGFNPHRVILTADEFRAVLAELEKLETKPKRGRPRKEVPLEATR